MGVDLGVFIFTRYNCDLSKKLISLSKQTYRDFVVVIADAFYWERSEGLRDLAVSLGLRLVHIPVLYTTMRYGKTFCDVAVMKNKCINSIYSKYIVILGDDQLDYDSRLLECMYSYLSDGYAISMRVDRRCVRGDSETSMLDPRGSERHEIHSTEWWTGVSGVRRDHLEMVNGFDERIIRGVDMQAGYMMWCSGVKLLYVPDVISVDVNYRGSDYFRGYFRPPFPHRCEVIEAVGNRDEFYRLYPYAKAYADDIDWENIGKYKSSNHPTDRGNDDEPNIGRGGGVLDVITMFGYRYYRCKVCGIRRFADYKRYFNDIKAGLHRVPDGFGLI